MPLLLILLILQSLPGVTVTPPCEAPIHEHRDEDELGMMSVEIMQDGPCDLLVARLTKPITARMKKAPDFIALKEEMRSGGIVAMVPTKVKKGDKAKLLYCRVCHLCFGLTLIK